MLLGVLGFHTQLRSVLSSCVTHTSQGVTMDTNTRIQSDLEFRARQILRVYITHTGLPVSPCCVADGPFQLVVWNTTGEVWTINNKGERV